MTNNIFEDLPKRKHPQAAAGGGADAPEGGGAAPAAKSEGGGGKKAATGGTEENSEKRVRQAVYDIRYRARREDIDLKAAYSQYMSNTSMSAQEQAAVKAKLFGKEGGVKEQVSVDGADWVVEDLASAMKKVFVEKVQEEGPIELVYERMMQAKRDGKDTVLYSIRVTDPKSGKTYTRDANREKITQLRAAGLKVEMSDHKPGQAQRDMSKKNDGNLANNYPPYNKVTRGDVIAGATGKDQMGGKRKVSEGTTLTGARNSKKIDVMKSGEMNNVTVFPKDGSDPQIQKPTIQAGRVPSKSLTLFQEKHGMESTICPKHGTTPCKCKEGGDKEDERDTRADSTIRNVVKNKLRAMGMKTPLIMKDPEELEKEYAKIASADTAKVVDEGAGAAARLGLLAGGALGGAALINKAKEAAKKLRNQADQRMGNKPTYDSYEPEGEVVSEEEADRLRDRRNMHGGVDGNTNYKRPGTGVRTLADKQSKPKPHPTNKSAIETVAAELRARYGGSAVIGGSLKKKES